MIWWSPQLSQIRSNQTGKGYKFQNLILSHPYISSANKQTFIEYYLIEEYCHTVNKWKQNKIRNKIQNRYASINMNTCWLRLLFSWRTHWRHWIHDNPNIRLEISIVVSHEKPITMKTIEHCTVKTIQALQLGLLATNLLRREQMDKKGLFGEVQISNQLSATHQWTIFLRKFRFLPGRKSSFLRENLTCPKVVSNYVWEAG